MSLSAVLILIDKIQPWLKSLRVIWGLLFIFIFINFAFRGGNPNSNEITKLLGAKAWLSNDLLQNDFFFRQTDATKIPFYIPFYLAVLPWVQLFSLAWASLIGRIFCFLFVSYGLARLAYRIGLNAIVAVIAIFLFVSLKQSFCAYEWMLGACEPKVISYGLILLAIDCFLAKKFSLMSFLLGLSSTFHILVGGWATLIFTALLVVSRTRLPFKRLATMAVSWSIGGWFALFAVIVSILKPSGEYLTDPNWIYVVFRNPHHLLPSHFKWNASFYSLPLFLFIILAASKLLANRKDMRHLAVLTLCGLIPCGLGFITHYAFPSWLAFLKTYPFRVGSLLVVLLGSFAAVASFFHLFRSMIIHFAALLLVVGLMLFNVRSLVTQLAHWPLRSSGDTYYEACQWIQQNTSRQETILAPPGRKLTYYFSERSLVATFKQIPSSKKDIYEWYQRLLDLNGSKPIKHRSFAVAAEIDKNFTALSSAQYAHLAKKYHARYLVTHLRRSLSFKIVFKSKPWAVYDLTRTINSRGDTS